MSDSLEDAIVIEDLVVRYRGKTAVNGLSLTVPRGSMFALLGDNGAGKSTTMKVLTGLVKPDRGITQILGLDCWSKVYELRHRVGFVPEKPKFYDWMTVAEIGWFTAAFHRQGFLAQFDAWLDKLQLDRKKRLKDLSKGGYARVGLALALAADPQVLLLDEPTSGLDLLTRRALLSSLVELAAEGRTILISSHSIAELERFASHAAFVKDGKVLLSATLEELRARFRRVEFRVSGLLPDMAPVGKVLHTLRAGRFMQYLIQDPDHDALAMMKESQNLIDFEESPVSLEEVYTGLMSHHDARSPAPVRQRTEEQLEDELYEEGV